MTRAEIEATAVKVLGYEPEFVRKLSEDMLMQAVLRKLSPRFDASGRSPEALEAAFAYAVGSTSPPSPPEPQRREQPAPSGDPHLDTLNAQLREIQHARENEWKQPAAAQPQTGQQRTDELSDAEVDAQVRQLEAERASAWRG